MQRAQAIQRARYANEGFNLNAQLEAGAIEKYCPLNDECEKLIARVFDVMGLSARGYHKILKLARTIADLAGCEDIAKAHIVEAVQYRSLDRKYWN